VNFVLMYSLLAAEAAVLAALYLIAAPRYAAWLKQYPPEQGRALFAPVSLFLLDMLKPGERFSEQVGRIHQLMVGLYGAKAAMTSTRWCLVRMVEWVLLALLFCTMLAAVSDNTELLLYGAAMSGMLPVVQFQQLSGKLKRKKQDILLELPEVLNQLLLLIGAGETAPQALIRTVESRQSRSSPLIQELSVTVQSLKLNGSFTKALEDFSKRCGMQEVSLFTTTLLLNHRRGGDELAMSLKELSVTLWEKRKAVAKTLGEEASSKLVFPMVLIFFMVMVVVAAPAMLMMDGS
jgi:tight adherence protein C